MKRLVCVLAGAILFLAGRSQVIGKISGIVTDENKVPVKWATIHIWNTDISVISNAKGEFNIRPLPEGRYTIEISAVGFATVNREVNASGSESALAIRLKEAGTRLDEVLVTAQKKEEDLQ
ncbi:MAG TPA: carboxypeptidase-like regulatory domain-containing protein, partial [Puia sp.]